MVLSVFENNRWLKSYITLNTDIHVGTEKCLYLRSC